MNRPTSYSVNVVKRDEKETRLTQFVLSEIASGRVSLSSEWSVVALSMDSPVIAVLKRVVAELGGAPELTVRVVLAARANHAIGDGIPGVGALFVRASQSNRLLDAHEQLVIGAVSSWTGDCMRRNPRERDAFETFAGDNAVAAGWARTCFQRLWDCSVPVTPSSRRFTSLATHLGDMLAGERAKPDGTVVLTSRH